MDDLPAPPVPPDCDLRGMPGFMLDTERLMASELWALSDGATFKAAMALWCRAWRQVPAASLPDDEATLRAFAGVTAQAWKKCRDMALRGFVKCSDGRLYHKTLAEDAARAWGHRQMQREKASKRWGNATGMPRHSPGTPEAMPGTVQGHRHTDYDAAASSSVASAAAAAPLADFPPDDPTGQPCQIVRDRNVGDLQTAFGRIYVPPGDRDGWAALLAEYGWDPLADACQTLAIVTPPGRRILLSRVTLWLSENYQRKASK